MKVLVACEESQVVTKEFRKLGHEAYSCDIIECSGGYPEWHIKDDIDNVLYHCDFSSYNNWDLVIAFPPCTHLASSGARWFKEKIKDGRQQQGIDFFMRFVDCCDKVAIENPIGIMSTKYRKPDQIIQPYEFGHNASKGTCLWLKNLPKLQPTNIVEPEYYICKSGLSKCNLKSRCFGCDNSCRKKYDNQTPSGQNKLGPSKNRAKIRSKTYLGIAKAMAEQWSKT